MNGNDEEKYAVSGGLIGAEDICFVHEEFDGNMVTINELKQHCQDGIILWITGSGRGPQKTASYKCGVEYHGHGKLVIGDAGQSTANQTMIKGAIECVKRIQKPYRLYLVSATTFGIVKGFSGKGPNTELVQELLNLVMKKECQLTEVRYLNAAETIKAYLRGLRE